MKKGIVMEIDESFLTLLTPDGQFLKAKKQKHPYAIGEEILFSPILQKIAVRRFLGIKPLSIAAAAILVIFGSMLPVYESNKAYAYMSIDVNPSIEMGINKKMQVVNLKAFNTDGKKIISHIGNWEKKSVTDFTQSIIKEMKKEGYLHNHHSMVISTVRTESSEEKTEKQLKENVGRIKEMAKENNLQVTVLKGTEKELEKAHQLGITTGKYKESKSEPAKMQNHPSSPQSQEKGNRGAGAQNKVSHPPVNREGTQNENPNPSVQSNFRNPQSPGQNKQGDLTHSDQDKQGNPTHPDQNKQGNPHYSTPPGQLKKAEQVPKKQWKDIKRETRMNRQTEMHSSSINENQGNRSSHGDQSYHNEK